MRPMHPPLRLARAVALALLLATAACSSPNPNLYTIAPITAASQTGAPKVIALRQIGLARYLERSQIVRSSENYRLDVMANDWWGEPLGAMLVRVLVEELASVAARAPFTAKPVRYRSCPMRPSN